MHPKVQKKIVLVFGIFIIILYCGHRQLALGISILTCLSDVLQRRMLTINWSVDRTGKTFSLSVSVIEIYLIHNISAPDIVFSTYNNISPPNCAIILHFALNTKCPRVRFETSGGRATSSLINILLTRNLQSCTLIMRLQESKLMIN